MYPAHHLANSDTFRFIYEMFSKLIQYGKMSHSYD